MVGHCGGHDHRDVSRGLGALDLDQEAPCVLATQTDVQEDCRWPHPPQERTGLAESGRMRELEARALEIFLVDEQVLEAVLHDEDREAMWIGYPCHLGRHGLALTKLDRDGRREGRARPGLTDQCDPAAQELGELPGEGET